MDKAKDILVSLDNAGVCMSEKWLVRGVSLDVRRGEIVTLIGPNGSGKSTTAKIALGVVNPSEGSAQCRHDICVSYVPQKLSVDWTLPLTVNRFMTLTQTANERDAQRALSSAGIEHLKNSQVRNLSGGEFQRVLLARAVVNKPELLVLDEPVQGVDFNGEIALYRLIEDIRTELNCGIILISHDLHVVMSSTNKVICLNGHVCCSGNPEAVASAPDLELYLVTVLQMNWHFIDIAMIMSIYLIEQFKNLITVSGILSCSRKTELENDKLKRNA